MLSKETVVGGRSHEEHGAHLVVFGTVEVALVLGSVLGVEGQEYVPQWAEEGDAVEMVLQLEEGAEQGLRLVKENKRDYQCLKQKLVEVERPRLEFLLEEPGRLGLPDH